MAKRVRVNRVYTVMHDQLSPTSTAVKGQRVRVINLPGAPLKANTFGLCYIEDARTREFLGLICTNSLK